MEFNGTGDFCLLFAELDSMCYDYKSLHTRGRIFNSVDELVLYNQRIRNAKRKDNSNGVQVNQIGPE